MRARISGSCSPAKFIRFSAATSSSIARRRPESMPGGFERYSTGSLPELEAHALGSARAGIPRPTCVRERLGVGGTARTRDQGDEGGKVRRFPIRARRTPTRQRPGARRSGGLSGAGSSRDRDDRLGVERADEADLVGEHSRCGAAVRSATCRICRAAGRKRPRARWESRFWPEVMPVRRCPPRMESGRVLVEQGREPGFVGRRDQSATAPRPG